VHDVPGDTQSVGEGDAAGRQPQSVVEQEDLGHEAGVISGLRCA
jgi:hypothetical protein